MSNISGTISTNLSQAQNRVNTSLMLDAFARQAGSVKTINSFGKFTSIGVKHPTQELPYGKLNRFGHYAVAFSGHLLNQRELLDLLGLPLECSEEIIAALLSDYGIEGLKKIRGSFAIIATHLKDGTVVLARDAFSQEPLFYAQIGKSTFFANTLEGLTNLPEVGKDLNILAASNFLSLGRVRTCETLVEGVQRMPAGTAIVIDVQGEHHQFSLVDWFSKCYTEPATDEQAWLDGLEHLIAKNLTQIDSQFGPLSLWMTDSETSLVLYKIAQKYKINVNPLYTVSAREGVSSPAQYAKTHGLMLGASNPQIIAMTDDIATELASELYAAFDEPVASQHLYNNLLRAQMCRYSNTSALTTAGGMELFGMKYQLTVNKWAKALSCASSNFIGSKLKNIKATSKLQSKKAMQLAAILLSKTGSEAIAQMESTYPFGSLLLTGLESGSAAPTLPVKECEFESAIMTALQHYLPGMTISAHEQSCARYQVPVYSGFLSPELVEHALKTPLIYRDAATLRQGTTPLSTLAKRLGLGEHSKPPKGVSFCHSEFSKWLRGPLRDLYSELIQASTASHEFINKGVLAELWDQHLAGKDRSELLFQALSLALWQEKLNVR